MEFIITTDSNGVQVLRYANEVEKPPVEEKPDSMTGEVFDLFIYASARYQLQDMLAERETYFADLYEDVSPLIRITDPDDGSMRTVGDRTEEAALRIIDLKQGYDKRIRNLQIVAAAWEVCVGRLDPDLQEEVKQLITREVIDQFLLTLDVPEGKTKQLIKKCRKELRKLSAEREKFKHKNFRTMVQESWPDELKSSV